MSFSSPWRHAWYVRAVALLRRVLRPFGRGEERFIERLTAAQNRRVVAHLAAHPPSKVLLIMPRCIKQTGCRADVQHTLQPCAACAGCALSDVAATCARYDVQALVAFRSHIAFELARRHRPDLIIASACHDRMIKALRSVPEIPALLAPLSGMERMCVNATVDLDWLDATLAGLATRRRPVVAAPAAACPSPPVASSADCP